MSKSQADRVAAKLEKSLAAGAAGDIAKQNGRALAAIALADRLPDQGEAVLKEIVQRLVARGAGEESRARFPGSRSISLYEMMHAIRDNLKIDLRESALRVFQDAADRSSGGALSESLRGAGE